MSIRSYIAMAYALAAVLVVALTGPGGAVRAERLTCAEARPGAAITARIAKGHARIDVDENWLGWLMWEPAVFHAPEIQQQDPTVLISCGAAEPTRGPARAELTLASYGDLFTVTLPVIDTYRHPAADYLIETAPGEADLPAYLSARPGLPEGGQAPLWLVIDTHGHAIELWSDTHAIDVVATATARIVTLAPDADLTDPVFVLRYRLSPPAPRLAASTQRGI